jgi:transcriptional regulator of heat shock response
MENQHYNNEKIQQANALIEQAKRLREEALETSIGEVSKNVDQKSISFSKTMINISYIVFGIVGIVGSFWMDFDMTKYTEFLKTFAYLWAPLVVAVGGGRAFKSLMNKKYNSKT